MAEYCSISQFAKALGYHFQTVSSSLRRAGIQSVKTRDRRKHFVAVGAAKRAADLLIKSGISPEMVAKLVPMAKRAIFTRVRELTGESARILEYDSKRAEVHELFDEGFSPMEIVEQTGLPKSTVYRIMGEFRMEVQRTRRAMELAERLQNDPESRSRRTEAQKHFDVSVTVHGKKRPPGG